MRVAIAFPNLTNQILASETPSWEDVNGAPDDANPQ
jgi:hypothetical protein